MDSNNRSNSNMPSGPATPANFAQSSGNAGALGADAMASIREQFRGVSDSSERVYATGAVNAAGHRIGSSGHRIYTARRQGERLVSDFVARQPVTAALMGAALGALFSAALISALRGGRR